MIAIVDAALGNLASVRHALQALGEEAELTSDPAVIRAASGLILPGQGAAPTGMRRLREAGLDGVVREMAQGGRPILGICLGMQLLFERSAEGDTPGLGLLSGRVRLLEGGTKLPHIGWNQVRQRGSSPLWQGIPQDSYFYFVHSYICCPAAAEMVAGVTAYGEAFCSAITSGRIWGTQFHPERSGVTGLQLLRNFATLCHCPR